MLGLYSVIGFDMLFAQCGYFMVGAFECGIGLYGCHWVLRTSINSVIYLVIIAPEYFRETRQPASPRPRIRICLWDYGVDILEKLEGVWRLAGLMSRPFWCIFENKISVLEC